MKVGDKFPVQLAGERINDATVKEVDEDKNTVTLVVPATLVTMSYRSHDELTPNEAVAPVEPETAQHILLTDQVVKPENPGEEVNNLATQQVPGQPETAPTEPQTTPVPEPTPVPEKVEEAVEREATQ